MNENLRNNILELRGVSKTFSHLDIRTHALRGVTLECQPGDFITIVGPSGSGKSTLLSVMGLLDDWSEGELLVDGLSIAKENYFQKARLRKENFAYVFQSYHLVPQLNVLDNVLLPLSFRAEKGSGSRKDRALASLEAVEMGHRARHYPAQLSGGQQQRVAIARALVCEPRIIFADEPTGNLDQANGDKIMRLLRNANSNGASIVLVTHDLRHTANANKVLEMKDGQLREAKPTVTPY